jgi:putative SOS response-associated peptidase YedK
MCGRYTLIKLADLVKLIPWLQVPAEILQQQARYNVAPSQVMPIITSTDVRPAQWGFVPSWTKETPKTRPINARAETIATSGMFRQAYRQRRCLVPADGFYEWRGAKPPKQPFYIRMKHRSPFAFAGLWERWRPPEGEPVETFTILTTSPNELLTPIHNRMPVIISPEKYHQWLEGDNPDELLQPYPAGQMDAVAVSTRVNSPKFDDPSCIEL